jgi:hypothetical protein
VRGRFKSSSVKRSISDYEYDRQIGEKIAPSPYATMSKINELATSDCNIL